MAISQLEIVTGCLFIAVVEKENTNGLLSDGGAGRGGEEEEGVDFQISDRDGTRLTMGGDELRDWRGQYGAPSQPSQRLAHTGDGCNLYGTHWIDEPHLSFNSLSSIQTHSTLQPSLFLQ